MVILLVSIQFSVIVMKLIVKSNSEFSDRDCTVQC